MKGEYRQQQEQVSIPSVVIKNEAPQTSALDMIVSGVVVSLVAAFVIYLVKKLFVK